MEENINDDLFHKNSLGQLEFKGENISVDALQTNRNGIPTFHSLQPLVLYALKNEETYNLSLITKSLTNTLMPEKTNDLADNYRDTLKTNAEWAVNYLFNEDLLSRPSRAMYRINEKGMELLSKQANYASAHKAIRKINNIYTNRLVKEKKAKSDVNDDKTQFKNSTNIIDNIQSEVDEYNDKIQEMLLSQIMNKEPAFFEQLVIDLLSNMGYKGANGDAIRTQISRDNGVDGIINQDPLGTSTVYIQAKRYKDDNHISNDAILSFKGALESRRASKGVFITTSSFSKKALEEAERLSIVTIDGKELTQLMLEYHVGVQIKGKMELLGIDNDYFE